MRNHKLYRFAATYNSLFGDVIINTPLEEIDKLAELTVTYVYVTSRLDKVLHDAIYNKIHQRSRNRLYYRRHHREINKRLTLAQTYAHCYHIISMLYFG